MGTVIYNHNCTVPYDFDTENITESNIREIIKRHYDFLQWCKDNTEEPYHISKSYRPTGISVNFKSEKDYQHFINNIANYHWLFLHN